MRIHYIIHAAFEKLGTIEDWARVKKHTLSGTHSYQGEKLPNVNEFDFLIVMGGPQSPLHLDRWPYLQDEMNLINQAILANKPVLGICLGAQLIAQALGAKTEHSPQGEIGVFPVELLPDAKHDPLFCTFENTFPVMHWHNDMPGLPTGARLLAKSAGCPRQAFSIGDRIYGLQFHLEITQECIKEMLIHCEGDLKAGPYMATQQKLLNEDLTKIHEKMFAVLEYLSAF